MLKGRAIRVRGQAGMVQVKGSLMCHSILLLGQMAPSSCSPQVIVVLSTSDCGDGGVGGLEYCLSHHQMVSDEF